MERPEKSRSLETERGYDSVAADYATRAASRSTEAEAFAERFIELLAPGSSVVDLGCGPGADLSRFVDHGLHAVGVDRSRGLLALAVNSERVRADMTRLPFSDNSFDAAWSHASLLHIDPASLPRMLDETSRVVRSNGLIGFSTSLGGDSGWEAVPAAGARVPELPNGRRRWFVHHDTDALHSAMADQGWHVLEVTTRSSHRDWLQVLARTPI